MLQKLILLVALLQAASAAPQFITFKDGKVGVNFGGFHADAGLGGLLTGNAAHGGLSASAGTPWGSNAAAGLGGSLDGHARGLAYAGAQAIPSVGASTILGGSAGEQGFAGSEAHADGKITTKTITTTNHHHSLPPPPPPAPYEPVTSGPTDAGDRPTTDGIQKIKPPKKYSLIKNNNWTYSTHNQNNNGNNDNDASAAANTGHHRTAGFAAYIANRIGNEGNDVADGTPLTAASTTTTTTTAPTRRQTGNGDPLADNRSVNDRTQTVLISNKQRHQQRRRQHRERQRERKVQVQRARWTRPTGDDTENAPTPYGQPAEHTKVLSVTIGGDRPAAESEVQQAVSGADTYTKVKTYTHSTNIEPQINAVHSKQLLKRVHFEAAPLPAQDPSAYNQNLNDGGGLIGGILNIPIGILRSLQDSIGGLEINKSVQHTRI